MATVLDTLHADIDEIMPGVIADRRYLHTIPELGLELHQTAAYVAERLRAIGVEDIQTGIAVTGITALIHGTKPSSGPAKVALLRADMDALPILEANDVEYRSTVDGKMHACGHDAHTAMLLAISQLLVARRDQFSGIVKVLFQPGEEGPGGAKPMIEQGVLENPHVDAVFGMHVGQDTPAGQIKTRSGPAMASADSCVIVIQGKGGHGASPHLGIDPIVIAAQIVGALQTIVSRNVDPIDTAVVTVGMIGAGEASNVIPDTAEMRLTIRAFKPEVRALLQTRITAIVENLVEAFGATATIDYQLGYPPTVNDPAMTDFVMGIAAEVLGAENVSEASPKMGAEDFSYFLEERPGCFFFVGTRNEDRGLVWGHHHPRFDIDEEGLIAGIETMTTVVTRYLNS
ncbi:amidohydrolase [soil metagenome]